MTAADGPVLLDTNILVHLARGKAAGRKIDEDYKLAELPLKPLIAVVTVGECLSLARVFNWGDGKTEVLRGLLKQLVVVDINDPAVLQAYAEIDFVTQKSGAKMGKNDLWIAAVAKVTRAWLLTTDRDFLPLTPDLLPVVYLDPSTLPSGE